MLMNVNCKCGMRNAEFDQGRFDTLIKLFPGS